MKTSTATTLAGGGIVIGDLTALNVPLLLHGDATQIGIVIKAIFVIIFAWYTNRKGNVGSTVPVGTPQGPAAPVAEGTTEQK